EVLPLRSTVLRPGMNPTRRGSPGPRLDAADALAVYPVPASEGRGWKYWGIGLPCLSRNSWPMSADPTTCPLAFLMKLPFARKGNRPWPIAHTTSGYRMPVRTASASVAAAAVRSWRRMSVHSQRRDDQVDEFDPDEG